LERWNQEPGTRNQEQGTRNKEQGTRNNKFETIKKMKKTLSINISGFVFHIDEDAYEKLHRYLDAIKSHFTGFDGKEEVIADIEARIAEILQGKISASKEVINLEDVGEVIGILGQPSDFAMDDENGNRQEPSYTVLPKRLYRDPERKVIGGVCSGLGAYFNLDPVWVRVIFIIMILASGFGFLVYLILWLAVPEARTTSERLEMRGEPVNISNIEKSVSEEVHQLKNKINDLASKAKRTYRENKDAFDNGQRDQFMTSIGEIGRVFLRIFVVIAGMVILFIGLALSAVYLSIVFHLPIIFLFDHAGPHTFPLYPVIDRIFENDADLRTFFTSMMILLGIPLLMMLWGGIRMIFNLPRVKFLSGIAAIIWICALVITMIFGGHVFNSFRYQGNFNKETILAINKPDTLHLVTIKNMSTEKGWHESDQIRIPEWRIAISEDAKLFYGIPVLEIMPSGDSVAHLAVETRARGTFSDEANERAANISYGWKLSNDTLYLPDSFILPVNEKWRHQEARIELDLPVGTLINIDENMSSILGYNKNYSTHEMAGSRFLMTADGLHF
jgi:phage shock protein PspC (stress-responsive transcriptional regulator)